MLTCYILLLCFIWVVPIKSKMSYKSTWSPSAFDQSELDQIDIGLTLSRKNSKHLDLPNGFTICEKFNYRLLGKDPEPNNLMLLSIGCEHNFHSDCIWAYVDYKLTFVGLGSFNWILKNSETESFMVWTTNRWHQVCLAFEANSGNFIFVKVKVP